MSQKQNWSICNAKFNWRHFMQKKQLPKQKIRTWRKSRSNNGIQMRITQMYTHRTQVIEWKSTHHKNQLRSASTRHENTKRRVIKWKNWTIRFEMKSSSNDGIQLKKLQINTHHTHVREWIITHHRKSISQCIRLKKRD